MSLFQNISATCLICGHPLWGTYYVDSYGNKVCEQHYETVVHCSCCGCFCGKESVDLSDGVIVCKDCHQNIPSDEECKQIIRHIRRVYRSLPIGAIPSFRLLRIPAAEWSEGRSVSGLASRAGRTYSIKVPEYLSKTVLAEVLAHEMLHLWLYDKGVSKKQRIIEGFCNLGSFEILSRIKTEKARVKRESILENPDAIYGDGFRIVKKVYDDLGWDGVINKILKQT